MQPTGTECAAPDKGRNAYNRMTPHENEPSHPQDMAKWRQFVAQMSLAFAGACSGVILYKALFPGFYYMTWIFWMILLWGLAAVAFLGHCLVLWIVARCKRVPLPSSPLTGAGFITGMLILVTLLVGFKVPCTPPSCWPDPVLRRP